MNTTLSKLISESYGVLEAERALTFEPDEFTRQQLLDAGKRVLSGFPHRPGACALMSAMWTAAIRDSTEYRIHAVAGSLFIDGHCVFGRTLATDQIKRGFSTSNLDWDGHCWVIFGNWIGDISIFRTAYSDASPRVLREKILSEFGEGRGLLIAPADSMLERGFRYIPQYVLTDDEITALLEGAVSLIKDQTGTSQNSPPENRSYT